MVDWEDLSNKIGAARRQLRPQTWAPSCPHPVLAEALGRWTASPADIRDHLGSLFAETVVARPRLIVELGTRGGVSTRALLAAAEVADAHLLSVDIVDCPLTDIPDRFLPRWSFVRADDVAFAGQPFADFCQARGLPAAAEAILVDTSHRYDHTRQEIAAWLPRLAPRGVIMFHDTHMGAGWYRRLDGIVSRGWNNERGVIRAIEEHLGRRYDETSFFSDVVGGFVVQHAPWSSGFTVLRRLDRDNRLA
jgi:hypothetical protein